MAEVPGLPPLPASVDGFPFKIEALLDRYAAYGRQLRTLAQQKAKNLKRQQQRADQKVAELHVAAVEAEKKARDLHAAAAAAREQGRCLGTDATVAHAISLKVGEQVRQITKTLPLEPKVRQPTLKQRLVGPEVEADVRARRAAGETLAAIGKLYDVSPAAVAQACDRWGIPNPRPRKPKGKAAEEVG